MVAGAYQLALQLLSGGALHDGVVKEPVCEKIDFVRLQKFCTCWAGQALQYVYETGGGKNL